MKDRPLKLGIVGAGLVTSGSHLPALVNMPDIDITWICDRSLATAQRVARSYKIAQAYSEISQCPDVDVVLVAVPVGARRVVVPEVLARGWHTFCEKPFAITLAEHDAYLDAAARYGVQIGVAQTRRYTKQSMTGRSLLQRHVFGPVLGVAAAEGSRMTRTNRGAEWYVPDTAASGGMLAELGVHVVDQLMFVLGATDVAVRSSSQAVHLGLDLATSVRADVRTASGATLACGLEFSIIDDLCNGIFVEFRDGVLHLGTFLDDTITLVSREGETLCEFAMREGASTIFEAFCLEWRDFLRQCRTGTPSHADAATVRPTTALIEACSARARAGDAVAEEVAR